MGSRRTVIASPMANLGLLLLLCGLIPLQAAELPNVKFVECEVASLKGYDACLKITFTGLTEYAGLMYIQSEKVMEGKLVDNDSNEIYESHVSVTLDDDGETLVMISDPKDDELYHLRVDLETGLAENEELDWHGGISHDAVVIPDNTPDYFTGLYTKDKMIEVSDRQTLPSAGMKMRTLFVVDKAFQAKYNNDAGKVKQVINGIYVHANSFFAHTSLTTRIELENVGIKNLDENLPAGVDEIYRFRDMVQQKTSAGQWPTDIHSYSLISYDNGNQFGTLGIAWVFTTCSSTLGYRSNIQEYNSGTISAAQTLVHEIGHNLGMRHDFVEQMSNPRTADNGQACTNVGGYMDYRPNPNKWSQCSIEDLTKYYNNVRTQSGQFCLPLLTGGPAPPNPEPTTPAPPPAPTCGRKTWVADGYCDVQTNTKECFFDGGDCCPPYPTNKNWKQYCGNNCQCIQAVQESCPRKNWVGDGWCDDVTNTPECNYDGGDCCFEKRSNWKQYCNECKCKNF